MNRVQRIINMFDGFFILTPQWRIAITIILLCIGILFFILAVTKKLPVTKAVVGWFIVSYLFLMLASTLLTRIPRWHFVSVWKASKVRAIPIPFQSYYLGFKGETSLFRDIVFNTCALLPVGMLLPTLSTKVTLKQVAVFSLIFSGIIECGQFCFRCGTFQVDDIIHNVLGCLLGYCIYRSAKKIIKELRKRNKGKE